MISGKVDGNQQEKQYVLVEDSSVMSSGRIRSAPKKSNKIKLLVLLSAGAITCLIVMGFVFIYKVDPSTPLDEYSKTSTHTLYYPTELPSDYTYVEDSVNVDNGITTYRLKSPEGEAVITLQQGPDESVQFNIDGFSPSASNIGSMLVGKTQGAPTAIIRAGSTLITIKGSPAASQGFVSKIAYALKELPKR